MLSLVLLYFAFRLVQKYSRPLLSQSDLKLISITIWSLALSHDFFLKFGFSKLK